MALYNGRLTDHASLTQARRQPGPIRRFFDGLKRFEEAMDYTPVDYLAERLSALEARVIELETQLSSRPPLTAAVVGAGRNTSA